MEDRHSGRCLELSAVVATFCAWRLAGGPIGFSADTSSPEILYCVEGSSPFEYDLRVKRAFQLSKEHIS